MCSNDTIDQLCGYTTATLYEANGKSGDCGPTIVALTAGLRMVGRGFTVRCLPGDSRAIIEAMALAPPASVLAIDVGGTPLATAWGGTSSLAAKQRGLAGIVTNGAVRDIAEIREIGLPVFAAGVSARGTQKSHPGETNVTISIGAAAVRPGDIVVGDDDGVVVLRQEQLRELILKAERQKAREEEIDRRIRAGEDLRTIFGLQS